MSPTVQMLSNLKMIFIHGVNDQKINYSQVLFDKILTSCRVKLGQWDGIARTAKSFFQNIPIDEIKVCTGILPLQSHAGYWKHDKTASIIADEVLKVLCP